ncbi:FAD-dependent oxidoreductase [Hippea jasoniae]|uniref:FAD-dependent oxidoreductase n=1 Tax=Hippea jasoniae TaxID=944479 RepID=UPI0005592EA7|nr:FAD-dependent oxidoreductase [Hippea jasoniae]
MESLEYQDVVSKEDIKRFPISITTTEVNLTSSWRFMKPIIREKISPCSIGCPANTNIPLYINHLLKGDIRGAVEILRNENPFPATCGRVCPHFCQQKCNRLNYDGSVEIREIEKFVGDYALNIPYNKPKVKRNKRVAIIGSGPAGLSCAYFLAKNGFEIKIFEKENKPGGLLVTGIPEYRLPRQIVEKEIGNIISMGNITIETGSLITPDNIKELKRSFDAIFISTGLMDINIPDNITIDNSRVWSGYEFLRVFNMDSFKFDSLKDKKIAIIGGGNAAFDVARVAMRMGGDVEIIYRRTLKEAPAFEEEKNEALEEGIKITEKMVVDHLKKEDKINLTLRNVKKIEGSDVIPGDKIEKRTVDMLIFATGQKKKFNFGQDDGVFAGGDYAHGAKSVIEAIASGKREAYKIMKYLGGMPHKEPYINDNFLRSTKDFDSFDIVGFDSINLFYFPEVEPIKPKKVPPQVRNKNFDEINLKLSMDELLKEAKRCFSCGVCNQCKTCWFYCPDVCIDVQDKVEFDYDYCKGCGVCSVECPRGVIELVEDK